MSTTKKQISLSMLSPAAIIKVQCHNKPSNKQSLSTTTFTQSKYSNLNPLAQTTLNA